MKTFNELINEFAIEMARKNAPISGIELANEEGLEKIGLAFCQKDRIGINSKNNVGRIKDIWTKGGQVFLSVKKEETPNNEEPILPNTFGAEYCPLEMNGLSMKVMYRITTPVGKGIWKEYTIRSISLQIQNGKTISQLVEEKAKEDFQDNLNDILNSQTMVGTEEYQEIISNALSGFAAVELELVPKGKR